MKFIVNSLLFSKQVQSISGVLTNNNTVPIINCFHFHLDEGVLTVRATDLETTLVARVEVESDTSDGFCDIAVPSRLLLDILKNLDDVPLTFSADETNYGITIVSGEGRYRLAGKNAETFPVMPVPNDTTSFEMPSEVLFNAIAKTSFATSTDEMRQQMSGIYCEMDEESVTFVATDAHKLVRYRRHDLHADTAASFILPRKPILILKGILPTRKEDSMVNVEYNTKNVFFSFENFVVVCRLVEGRYPNYEAAIPKENPNRLTVDRLSFFNSLRRVGLFANQASHQVRLAISQKELVLSAEDFEFSNEANEKMPCQYEGDPMEIGFNAKFLAEMVQNIDTEQMVIEMSHPSRAGIIFPVRDEDDGAEDILMLVMPVMLAN